jgi:hypothetical protein
MKKLTTIREPVWTGSFTDSSSFKGCTEKLAGALRNGGSIHL